MVKSFEIFLNKKTVQVDIDGEIDDNYQWQPLDVIDYEAHYDDGRPALINDDELEQVLEEAYIEANAYNT